MASAHSSFSPSSRARLTPHDVGRFAGSTLFDRLGRTLCGVGRLPRKELYESWEVARRVRRLFRGGRVVDVGGGHGLLAHVMLLLDDTSSSAVVVDEQIPRSARFVADAIAEAWPRLAGRVSFVQSSVVAFEVEPNDVVVSCHACGALSDRVIARAADAGAKLAVLPCCHDVETCDTGRLDGWMDLALAIDATRAVRLEGRGYRVWTQSISPAITPKHRLLIGEPAQHRTSRVSVK